MATAVYVPVEEYLRTLDHELDCEYVDGVIEERPMGQYDQASWQQAIQRWFIEHGKGWNARVRAEYRVRVSATRYRVPDVCVFSRSLPTEQVLTHAPLAVFEVMSPEDRLPRMLIKLRDYEAMGIGTVMLIDPPTQVISRFVEGKLEPVTEDLQHLAGHEGWIDWRRVRECLDD